MRAFVRFGAGGGVRIRSCRREIRKCAVDAVLSARARQRVCRDCGGGGGASGDGGLSSVWMSSCSCHGSLSFEMEVVRRVSARISVMRERSQLEARSSVGRRQVRRPVARMRV